MAEFYLGRIKFVYQGMWATGTSYVVDDVVTVGGKTYICLVNHTAGTAFNTDLTATPPKWNLVADGQEWKGSWASNTFYNVGDLVKYFGIVYLCNTAHTSGSTLETNQSYWDLFANSFNWTGPWATNTAYHVGDIVSYGGYVYYCITAHTSAATTTLGLESNQNYWQVFNSGITYLGTWAAQTRYRLNDVVKDGANLYICVQAHTSGNTIDITGSYFQLFLPGFEFQNSWNNTTNYIAGDIVTYGGYTYVAKQNNVNLQPSSNPTAWAVFTTGFNFLGDWNNTTYYKVGSVVREHGYTYLATSDSPFYALNISSTSSTTNALTTTSTSGLQPGMSVQFSYTPITATATATTAGTNQILLSSTAGIVVGMPITFSGTGLVGSGITTGTLYYVTSVVGAQITISLTYNGTQVTLTNNSTGTLTATIGGLEGGVSSTTTYFVAAVLNSTDFTISMTPNGSVVPLINSSGAMNAQISAMPGDTAYWQQLNSGLQWTNNPQSYTNITGTNIIGTGSGAAFDVTRSGTVYTVTLHAGITMTGYNINDEIKLLGTSLGGISPANDLTVTVTAVSSGAISTFTFTGISVTWTAGIFYELGDIVFFGPSSYTCVQAHNSTLGNRPDADVTGTYWNLMAAGAETSILTTNGDTVYFGPNGPTRLPVGTEGQLLKVSNGLPSWSTYGVINNLVYVSTTGVDEPAPLRGLTFDAPWKTIRYAAQQVEQGYQNPQAQYLIQVNKQFLMKEVSNWITYTYQATVTASSATTNQFTANSTAGLMVGMPIQFTGTVFGGVSLNTTYYVTTISGNFFTVSTTLGGTTFVLTTATGTMTASLYYNQATCERDTGLLIDSIVYDLGHGGTAKTVYAANQYYTVNGNAYITSNFGTQVVETVGAYNYLSTLLGDVLSNTAPAQNYQTLNGVPVKALQQINTSYTAESGTVPQVQSLVKIVTDGLTAGNAYGIPVPINSNTTIWVKTGTYNEVLPINIPINTVVFGDELRSTTVQPRPADSLLVNDVPKTTAALKHIKSLLPNLISNTLITPTSGNTTPQVTTLPAGDVGSYFTPTLIATATTATTNEITTSSTASLLVGDPVVFSSSIGGLVGGTTYYVYSIVDAFNFTVTMSSPVTYQSTMVTLSTATGSVSFTYGASAVNSVVANSYDMENIVNVGLTAVPSFVLPQPLGYNTTYLPTYGNAVNQIQQNRSFITSEINAYLQVNYPSVYAAINVSTCDRDVNYVLDAIVYDMTYSGNWQSNNAGSAYYQYYSLTIASTELTATVAAYTHLQSILGQIVQGQTVTPTSGNTTPQVTTGSVGNATSATTVQSLVGDVITWINTGISPTVTYPTITVASTTLQTAFAQVQAQRSQIQLDASSWVQKFYQSMNFNVDTCKRDVGYLVDALSYDLVFGSNFATVKAAMAYLRNTTSAQVVINQQKSAEIGMLNFLAYRVKSLASSGAVATAMTIIDDAVNFINNTPISSYGNGIEVVGQLAYNNTLATINGVEIIRANLNFLANESTAFISASYGGTVTAVGSNGLITTSAPHNLIAGDPVVFTGTTTSGIMAGVTYWVISTGLTTTQFEISATYGGTAITTTPDAAPSLTVHYSYNPALCQRDMLEWMKALIIDMQYTGNYRSLRAAQLYVNAVNGSQTSNMFLVRNSTGLRNMTLSGLTGTLSSANAYGTKRPTAGAYTSLDPGFGPWDMNAWITSRSCFPQNITLFGYGCTGIKIDGALHAGGNRSIVANDYTTLLGDGIGVWCTGSNALTELVSVFAYYSYAGYLAELGGKIRATNGNSSYGTYGVIAEGVDTYETPLYGNLNNRGAQAYITNVFTDGTNEILRLEYENAGEQYTNANFTVSGSGYNVVPIGDEFRDQGVFETRLIDNGDGTSTSVGGYGYLSSANAAQGGTVYDITIAASDQQLSTAYVGEQIVVVAGTGVGQYAQIVAYNNGNKIASVAKTSYTPLMVTSSTATTNVFTLASGTTASLYPNMPIWFTGSAAFGGVSLVQPGNTPYYVVGASLTAGGTTFQVSTTSGGTAVTLTTATGTMYVNAAGWDHVVPGTTIQNALDLTTSYLIEPLIQYSGPGFAATSRTLPSSQPWTEAAYGAGYYVAVSGSSTTPGSSTAYSADGKTWTAGGALPASTWWSGLAFGGGQGATATAVVGGLGGFGAVLQAQLGTGTLAQQVVSISVINGGSGYLTAPTISITGGNGSGATAHAVVYNGAITQVVVDIPGSGYTSTPTVSVRTDQLTEIIVNTQGQTYTTAPNVTITGGGATTQATATAVVNSTYGVSSITLNTYGAGYTSTPTVTITDPNAKFLAISGSTTTAAYSTPMNLGSAWTTSTTALPVAGYASLAFGLSAVSNGTPIWVAVGGTSNVATTVDGNTWVARTIPTLAAGTYSAVTYGNGTFIAIATGTNATAISTNGVSWSVGGNLPASTAWISITYGNGRFVALAASGMIAISINQGLTWEMVPSAAGQSYSTLSSNYGWQTIRYGQGVFMAVSTSIGAPVVTSPEGINWKEYTVPTGTYFGLAFGNTYNKPLWAVLDNAGTNAISVHTGATPTGRMKVVSSAVSEIRMIEPGSGFATGMVMTSVAPVTTTATATAATTNYVTVASTTGIVANQPIVFSGTSFGGIMSGITYYVLAVVNTTTITLSTVAGGTVVTLTTATGSLIASTESIITVDSTENVYSGQPIEFTNASASGLMANVTYYVIGSSLTTNSLAVSASYGSSTAVALVDYTYTTYPVYTTGPIVTQTDPNKTKTAATRVRTGYGILGNPSFYNRGTANTSATASVSGDGFSDIYQTSNFINVKNIYQLPTPGANVTFASIPNTYYKLVSISNVLGQVGNYTATWQINPGLSVKLAPADGDLITTRLKYSQVRLTGHDFLYIGTGNQTQTNYPNVDITKAISSNQELASNGGRVFFTSTDQDGNFNVGNLFAVQQATGTATLNASAFNLSGLQSLQLGTLAVGSGSAVITQFSTDPYFTANSDHIVPTQKAIKSYITAQIGGGQSSLNVNTLTAGVIYLANNSISTTTGVEIKVTAKMNFTAGIDGAAVAVPFFMQK